MLVGHMCLLSLQMFCTEGLMNWCRQKETGNEKHSGLGENKRAVREVASIKSDTYCRNTHDWSEEMSNNAYYL